jgi:hypothetical protein
MITYNIKTLLLIKFNILSLCTSTLLYLTTCNPVLRIDFNQYELNIGLGRCEAVYCSMRDQSL